MVQHHLQVHCRKSPFPWLIMAWHGSMSSSPRLRASSSRPSSENVLVSIGSVLFSKDSVSAGVASCSFTGAGLPLPAGEANTQMSSPYTAVPPKTYPRYCTSGNFMFFGFWLSLSIKLQGAYHLLIISILILVINGITTLRFSESPKDFLPENQKLLL